MDLFLAGFANELVKVGGAPKALQSLVGKPKRLSDLERAALKRKAMAVRAEQTINPTKRSVAYR